ncbi:AFG1-like ATPase-domain-containing protein [Staphylotrichum tortipilum]|uniref:AFG1-like ATPase-domain-containing protein n=1 Tax=Staphylotrichum tortipilum TaxID=2831512 RepID=A0AAN6MIB4_9PEZI|nr:AFG1-like ATPase-domain-containing protein [Staphylotrichum longicolle]
MNRAATAVTITDPFVKYTSLIATGVYHPDAAQYRLAHHLQQIYSRLKDYTPSSEYQRRLQQISQTVSNPATITTTTRNLASPTHPIRRNPLFARFFQRGDGDDGRDTLALARVLTSHQAALHIDSPRGLFLSGGVGTGKSMLLDLLAEGLPTRGKRRWHFSTFMLHAFSRLEEFRRLRGGEAGDGEVEYSLLWMAKEMVETSPILFLDEFQLPDRAASKIMSNLFVAFFQLGGVLVASSNRMPEQLEKATGGYYVPPATGGLVERVLGLGRRQFGGELFGQSSDFAAFLEVLKMRCDFWHMEGTQDWRRRESRAVAFGEARVAPEMPQGEHLLGDPAQVATSHSEVSDGTVEPAGETTDGDLQMPAMYFSASDGEGAWDAALRQAAGSDQITPSAKDLSWESATLVVYGRRLTVPRQRDGVSSWTFSELVGSLGPADYVTLASNYHTFIIDEVPVLTCSAKNEARRFITLLDALYESRCKLVMRAEAGPDDLFFPDMRPSLAKEGGTQAAADHDDSADATYSETVAEVYQDQMSPFRPNVSTYSESPNAKYDPDQDSDFGKEQDKQAVDFRRTGAFTGEDERFAYKRATSRLWELCSGQWHTRAGDGWWQPLPKEARQWEGSRVSEPPPLPLTRLQMLMRPRPRHQNRRHLRQTTLALGLVLALYWLLFVWHWPAAASSPSSRQQADFYAAKGDSGGESSTSNNNNGNDGKKPPSRGSSTSPSSGARNPSSKVLSNRSLDEAQCNAYFPGLTAEIDRAVSEGPFDVKQSGNLGPLQGRIRDGQIYILHAQRKADLSREMLNSRTASLHQLYRALLTSPTPLPDTIFTLNFQDEPFGAAFTYSRHADPLFRPDDRSHRSFLMPHFSFWAWDLPFIGSMARAARAIADLEKTYTGRWRDKIPKAVWRGTAWFNSVHSPRLRQELLAAARGKPWADVEPLAWTNTAERSGGNASNALPIEGFCAYKYVVHTEGIAYSGRFQFLQMCASVVLTPPIQWMQHVTHLARPLFSSDLGLEVEVTERGERKRRKGWTPTEKVRRAWPVGYKPEEANIVFVAPDWSDLGATVEWLEAHPDVAEGIARRQRELFVGGGYFSPAAEACYWRAMVRGWAKVAETKGQGWEDVEGITFEAFSLTNTV